MYGLNLNNPINAQQLVGNYFGNSLSTPTQQMYGNSSYLINPQYQGNTFNGLTPQQSQQFLKWNLLNGSNPSPEGQGGGDNPEKIKLDKDGKPIYFKDMDMLGKANAVVGTGLDALKALNGAWGLFSSISQYGNQKALNKEHLANAKMKNEALRFDIDNRKAEVARWNQIRSNVNKQIQNTSAIKTSY